MNKTQAVSWGGHQRVNFRDGKLSREQIRLLKSTGWQAELPDTVTINKSKLLKIAKSGEPRPKKRNSKLGRALATYIYKSSDSYDADFDKKIRTLRPDWFTSRSVIVEKKKIRLLEMARRGEARPASKTTSLGLVLCSYTCRASGNYDAEFDKKIRELRPDWFVNQTDRASEKKRQLLEMARNGKTRPSQKTKLGKVLSHYTCRSGRNFDAEFDVQIRRLRPDWFANPSDGNKAKLLEMAQRGESRPTSKTRIGKALKSYTGKTHNSYNAKFDRKIRALRPDWFVRGSRSSCLS